jgi:hypothetical protein
MGIIPLFISITLRSEMLRFSCLILFFVLLLTSVVFGQLATITGSVSDKESNSPIPGANVVVARTSRGASTDKNGRFTIRDLDSSTYSISVSAIGFVKQTRKITLRSGDVTNISFSLSSSLLDVAEVTATGERSFSTASSDYMREIDFELRPKQSAQDMLRLVPGLVIAQHAGGGKAEQIYIRGFDADHGTDINLSVDGIPVNMVSHGHGQGYADLHFVIPEVIKGMEVYKGPYFAQFGDLATAGSVRLQTRESLDNTMISLEGGTFGTYRTLGMVQLPIQSTTTSAYVAGELFHSDGYFDSKIDFNRYNIFGKGVTNVGEKGSIGLWASAFKSKWNATGQIPARAVAEGVIDRFGSLDPSEGGKTQRLNVNMSFTNPFSEMASLFAQIYVSRYQFQLFSNFTFFANDSINGDGIEQVDERIIYGGRVEYSNQHMVGSLPSFALVGASLRSDDIDVQLYHQMNRKRIGTTANALIHQKNIAVYAQEDIHFSEFVRLQLGARTDMFFYDVVDQLNSASLASVSGSVSKAVVTPKANVVITPSNGIEVFLNFGGGFHSNDARAVASNKAERTLPRAWGAEVGFKVRPTNRLTLSATAWALDLENELVYVGDEGTTELNGATRRVGIDIEARTQLLEWLYGDLDVTVSRGRFKDLPAGENYIPLAPTLTSSVGLTARHFSGAEGSLRLRTVNSRPANETNSVVALGYTVFDASIAYNFQNYRLQLTGENIFNTRWNEAQFDTESRLRNESAPVSELHFTPGTPLNVRMKVEFLF